MTTVIWKEPKPEGTAKSRYKAKRKLVVEARRQAHMEEKRMILEEAGCGGRTLKASLLPGFERLKDEAPAGFDDVMNHTVNHAHQRSPGKKWS